MKTGNDGYFGSPYRLAAMYTTNINDMPYESP
jgi:hypothetical protein